MRKIYILLVFVIYSVPVFAIPGRLQGFSYSGKIKEETEIFNEKPDMYNEEPLYPHYLNDDGSDARTGAVNGGDKYKLVPVYSLQELYDRKNGYLSDDEDSDAEFEEEDEGDEEEAEE